MAQILEPEDDEASPLTDARQSIKRALEPTDPAIDNESADEQIGNSSIWLSSIVIIAIILLAIFYYSGNYFAANKEIPPTPKAFQFPTQTHKTEEPLVVYSVQEINRRITTRLKSFLKCSTTDERLPYVLSPETERSSMYDYYETRANLDFPLKKIQLIKPADIDSGRVWMVAYQDVADTQRYARFAQFGKQFYLQWSPSYAYGQMSWKHFARDTPSQPIQMRCYIRPHSGPQPPNIDPLDYRFFVIENLQGEFTAIAMMSRNAEGAPLLKDLSPNSRNPVNLMLGYTRLPSGIQQLTIHNLLHFQWHQTAPESKGAPMKLKQ